MKHKLTEMDKFEVDDYFEKWVKRCKKYQQGSLRYKKCTRRLKRAFARIQELREVEIKKHRARLQE